MDKHKKCVECGRFIRNSETPRRPRRFCSAKCRQRYCRANSIPMELRRLHRWVRADGKRPIMPNGRPASSTDPDTWNTYEACRSGSGDGFGIMLGDGLACWDFDHCLDADGDLIEDGEAARIVPSLLDEAVWTESSVSGTGLHIFVRSTDPSFKRPGVEFYSHSRFIRTTGKRWPR